MTTKGHRPDRVGDQIRIELGDLLTREVHDPGVGFVTLTRVQVSADLQQAKVYFTALGDAAARRNTERALRRAVPFLRRQIGRRLRLRRVPEFTFVYDESVSGQDRVERLLRELQEQQPGIVQDGAVEDVIGHEEVEDVGSHEEDEDDGKP
jgi:ribosome-binding factor A